jgi:hypothetical protein
MTYSRRASIIEGVVYSNNRLKLTARTGKVDAGRR